MNGDGYEVTAKGQAFLEKYVAFSSRSSRLRNELERVEFERETLERMCKPLENDKPKAANGRKRRK